MPLYEYECDACGHRFEIIRKFSDPPVALCPKCGGQVHKLQSAPAFHLKGSGWYITDYGRKESGSPGDKGDSASGEKSDSSSGETKSDTTKTTESKPEGKTDKTDKTDKTETKTSSPAPDKKPVTKPTS